MKAERIVANLLENDVYGPPAPDKFTDAMGTAKQLFDLERQKLDLMAKLGPSLGLERQLRKHGVTRDQVTSFIRAQDKYPGQYGRMIQRRGQLPADAVVGMRLDDGREIMFDLAVLPEK